MRRCLATAIAVLVTPFLMRAQTGGQEIPTVPPDSTITLSALLTDALRANPGVRGARTRSDAASARIDQAGAWDDPQFGVEFFATPVTSANPFKDGMETDYFLQQMLPLFGKKGLMEEAAIAEAAMVRESSNRAERVLVADVKRTYAMIAAAQRRLDINAENERLINQIISTARSRYEVGQSSQSDILKAEVELGRLQNERAGLEQELASATGMMNALLGRPAVSPLRRLADMEPHPISQSLDDISALALEHRAELRGMQFELTMNQADLRAAKREWVPDLMVRGMYKDMKESDDQWAAMFSINVPIAPWSSGKYSGRVQENELNVRRMEESIQDMRNMVLAEVRDGWAKSNSHWQQLQRYAGVMIPKARLALQSTLGSYQSGQADFLSLLDSYRMLQMLQMDYAMHVGEYFGDVALLERAAGTDL
jgi:cobalt-zinc-cadmium efflux system outer membrane protein